MKIPAVSIIIINWNSCEFLLRSLATVVANTLSVTYEIIVVDNGSFDGTGEALAASFPRVIFIQCENNLGFASANNLALARSCGRSILFLNPDTEIVGGAIQTLLSALAELPDAGMVGARLLNTDGSLQTTCVTAAPSFLNQIVNSDLLRSRFPTWKMWGMQALQRQDEYPVQVEAISGACMVGRRDVLDRVGGFSTDYFMYLEDMDLCVKIARAGLSIYYVPSATVIHHGGGSSLQRPESCFSSIILRESLVRFFQLHHGKIYAACYRAALIPASFLRLLLLILAFPTLLWRGGLVVATASFRKWCSILLWSLGLLQWANSEPGPQPLYSTVKHRAPGSSSLRTLP